MKINDRGMIVLVAVIGTTLYFGGLWIVSCLIVWPILKVVCWASDIDTVPLWGNVKQAAVIAASISLYSGIGYVIRRFRETK